jgi:alkylated DNA repair dioxygenase AlkB
MIRHKAWRPGLLEQVRPILDYGDEIRASRYIFGDYDWPAELAALGPGLLDGLDELLGVRFTHVFVQGYLNESASTPWHSDLNFDAMAILSCGATRRIGLLNMYADMPAYLSLEDGDVAFMPSGFQDEWQHSIPAETKQCSERLALVFRTNRMD